MLTKLSQEHKIVVSCMCSDHSKFTAGGSISNHAFGRGLDIASIDGEIVSPGSALAREVASELSELDARDPARRDRLAVRDQRPGLLHRRRALRTTSTSGFKQEITPDFKLPPELAAGARGRGGAAAPAVARRAGGRRARAASRRGDGPPPAPAARRARAARRRRPARPEAASGLFAAVAEAGEGRAAARGRRRAEAERRAPGSSPPSAATRRSRAARPTSRRPRPSPPGAAPVDLDGRAGRLPGRRRAQGADRRLDGRRGREARPARRSSP